MYASLYPNLIIQFNIAMNTQIGMVIIPDKIHDEENRRHLEHWTRSGAFFEDLHTHNWIMVGKRWFGLCGIMELVDHVNWYFNNILRPTNMYGFDNNTTRQYWQPVKFLENGWSPVVFKPVMNNDKVEEFLKYVAVHPNQKF